jgi:hypothetical protein
MSVLTALSFCAVSCCALHVQGKSTVIVHRCVTTTACVITIQGAGNFDSSQFRHQQALQHTDAKPCCSMAPSQWKG